MNRRSSPRVRAAARAWSSCCPNGYTEAFSTAGSCSPSIPPTSRSRAASNSGSTASRKHAGHQREGWRFELGHLHTKSASLVRFSDFALDIPDASSPVSCCRAMRLRLNAMTIAASSWLCGQAFPQELWESCGFRQSISGLRARLRVGPVRAARECSATRPASLTRTYGRRMPATTELTSNSETPLSVAVPTTASRRHGATASGAHLLAWDRYRQRTARPCTSAPTTVT